MKAKKSPIKKLTKTTQDYTLDAITSIAISQSELVAQNKKLISVMAIAFQLIPGSQLIQLPNGKEALAEIVNILNEK